MSLPRARHPASGLTVVELMVVIVIIAILAVVAVPAIRSSSYGGGVPGYAHSVEALVDEVRTRAVVSRRWQRLVVTATEITHDEATTDGLLAPVAWAEVKTLPPSGSVIIAAADDATYLDPGANPAIGSGLPLEIKFSPDGSASAGTIFLKRSTSSAMEEKMRVTVLRATAMVYVFTDW